MQAIDLKNVLWKLYTNYGKLFKNFFSESLNVYIFRKKIVSECILRNTEITDNSEKYHFVLLIRCIIKSHKQLFHAFLSILTILNEKHFLNIFWKRYQNIMPIGIWILQYYIEVPPPESNQHWDFLFYIFKRIFSIHKQIFLTFYYFISLSFLYFRKNYL